jgi:hypothetical protein
MNAADMTTALINRAKVLNEFMVTTEMPSDFRFNGMVPFDMQIKDGIIYAHVWGVDFDEACMRLDQFLDTCK